FQAEDGIRDFHVTGVQTCALPIYLMKTQLNNVEQVISSEGITTVISESVFYQNYLEDLDRKANSEDLLDVATKEELDELNAELRSEERRVGKECRSR